MDLLPPLTAFTDVGSSVNQIERWMATKKVPPPYEMDQNLHHESKTLQESLARFYFKTRDIVLYYSLANS